MVELLKRRTERLMERRRQDTRDQLEELNTNSGLTRRGAEREERRTRRRRYRELKGLVSHRDGLSSDDEETELESKNYQDSKGLHFFYIPRIDDFEFFIELICT